MQRSFKYVLSRRVYEKEGLFSPSFSYTLFLSVRKMITYPLFSVLFCTENPVPGISQSGADIGIFI